MRLTFCFVKMGMLMLSIPCYESTKLPRSTQSRRIAASLYRVPIVEGQLDCRVDALRKMVRAYSEPLRP